MGDMEHKKGKWINICDNGSHAVDIMNEDATIYIGSCQGTQIGIDLPVEVDEANAKHIVRCVNSHDALLEACKEAFCELCNINQNQSLIDKLDAAIAQAEKI